MRPDDAVAALARKQHGVWSRGQATKAGMTRSMIATRVRAGDWVRIDTAVFGHIAAPPTWERSVMPAVLAERVSIASHRTAAVLHGLAGFRRGRPEITVTPGPPVRGRPPLPPRDLKIVREGN